MIDIWWTLSLFNRKVAFWFNLDPGVFFSEGLSKRVPKDGTKVTGQPTRKDVDLLKVHRVGYQRTVTTYVHDQPPNGFKSLIIGWMDFAPSRLLYSEIWELEPTEYVEKA